MREVAELFEVGNPYFRVHDERGGATTSIGGIRHINFASYDYLGLNSDPRVARAAKDAIDQYGISASASRLVAGERGIHRELEAALAHHYGVEDAVAFVSGHATNVFAIDTILGSKDLVIYDAYSHNSIVKGATLSGAARLSFPHNDFTALETLLQSNRSRYENVLVVVEGIYSMDGDMPDLPALLELKKKFGVWLMVDEAHSTGVLGKTGHGIAEHFSIDPTDIDIWMGTMSKTLASSGGYICGSRELIELLKGKAAGFVYSVGLSPPLAAAALCSLQILEKEPERVSRLQHNGKLFLKLARESGLDTGFSEGYCVTPVLVGNSLKAARLSEKLGERAFNILPVIYPAVPMNSARLRFFITSEHTEKHIEEAIEVTGEELGQLNQQKFGEMPDQEFS